MTEPTCIRGSNFNNIRAINFILRQAKAIKGQDLVLTTFWLPNFPESGDLRQIPAP